MKKLAIITTHPIQYNVPIFKYLQKNNQISIKVFYTWERGSESFDRGFGMNVSWDIPLLEGYDFSFISNEGRRGRNFFDIRNPDLVSQIKTWGADAVLIFGWNYWSHLKSILYFSNRIPVLFRGDSHLLNYESLLKKILRWILLKWIYSHINYALYVGSNNKDYYVRHGLKLQKLVFAPHAVDNERFSFSDLNSKIESNKLREIFRVSDNDIVFMYIGKFEEKKDPFILLRSFKKLLGDNLKLIFVGSGKLESELRQESKDDKRIHFMGFQNQSNLPLVYKVADIVVLPSKGPGETWGLVVNESMASSRPVIVSNKVGSARDLVVEGVNGYIFESENEANLIEKMNLFINNPSNKKEMRIEALNIISNWSIQSIATAIELTVNK